MSKFYRGPSIDASYQVSVHLAKRLLRRRFFSNQLIRNKNCPWRPCLLTNLDEMNNIYREPAIDVSYQVSVHLAKRFQRKRFKKIGQSETRINCLWRPCLLTDRNEMSSLYRRPYKDASYQVSIHLAKWFQRRRLKKIGQSETRIACDGHVC